jgi:hypothetical protein
MLEKEGLQLLEREAQRHSMSQGGLEESLRSALGRVLGLVSGRRNADGNAERDIQVCVESRAAPVQAERSGFESLYTSRYGGSLSVRLQWMQSGASCSHCSHDHGSRCRTKRELWRTQEWTGRKKKRTRTTCFSLKVSRHPVVPGAYAIPRGPWRVRASMGLSAAL